MGELRTYELRDPAALIREVAETVTLDEDTAWLALVHHPSTNQTLLRVDPLPVPALLANAEDLERTVAIEVGHGSRRDHDGAVDITDGHLPVELQRSARKAIERHQTTRARWPGTDARANAQELLCG